MRCSRCGGAPCARRSSPFGAASATPGTRTSTCCPRCGATLPPPPPPPPVDQQSRRVVEPACDRAPAAAWGWGAQPQRQRHTTPGCAATVPPTPEGLAEQPVPRHLPCRWSTTRCTRTPLGSPSPVRPPARCRRAPGAGAWCRAARAAKPRSAAQPPRLLQPTLRPGLPPRCVCRFAPRIVPVPGFLHHAAFLSPAAFINAVFFMLRNVTPPMRSFSMSLYGWLGCITLETCECCRCALLLVRACIRRSHTWLGGWAPPPRPALPVSGWLQPKQLLPPPPPPPPPTPPEQTLDSSTPGCSASGPTASPSTCSPCCLGTRCSTLRSSQQVSVGCSLVRAEGRAPDPGPAWEVQSRRVSVGRAAAGRAGHAASVALPTAAHAA